MTDRLSKDERSANMRAVKGGDTKPEKLVRRISHAMGYRFRLHDRHLPGTPDLVFPSRGKVIFVHGCFWHGHKCRRGSQTPKTNTAFWVMKIAKNLERDAEQLAQLKKSGWRCLVVWECETKKLDQLSSRLYRFLR
jgi:DNA mismatch endonuclease, patch repair protein